MSERKRVAFSLNEALIQSLVFLVLWLTMMGMLFYAIAFMRAQAVDTRTRVEILRQQEADNSERIREQQDWIRGFIVEHSGIEQAKQSLRHAEEP